ncbi:exopolyphosphatase [Aliidiomarina sp.]|uniref:Ppx/GppA phosphatase family protein n=1 Tax=Aliidiomarina sp. TaxID=1872439 RepID=UPI003A4D291F
MNEMPAIANANVKAADMVAVLEGNEQDAESSPNDNAAQFAALDLGSNSFHLVTARIIDGHLQPLLRFKQRVMLANGLSKSRKLNEEAMQRGLDALRLCADRLQGFNPEQVYVVATHTLRQAKNADVFLARAAEFLPFPINIISGHEEARLIYRGVAHTSSFTGKRIVVDIGGGSTEIVAGTEFEAELVNSNSMGCVSFTERFFRNGKLSTKRFTRAKVAARNELESAANSYRRFEAEHYLGTSGTIKAICQWVQQREEPSCELFNREQLERCAEELLQHKHISEFNALGMDDDRKLVLAAGLAILIAVCEELDIKEFATHDSALREGVLYELANRVMRNEDVRQRTVDAMVARYRIDSTQAERVADTANEMLRATKKAWRLDSEDWLRRLSWAAWLHEVGLHINSSGIQNHSGYIVANADMPGFSKEEQALVAALVGNFRKKIRLDRIAQLQLFEQRDLHRLIALLRLAVIFNTDRQPSQLLGKVNVKNDMLMLTLNEQGYSNPMLIADLTAEVRQQLKLGITLRFHG